MFRLVERRWIYYTVSGVILLIGLITMIYSTVETDRPLQLGIDFTGGTIFDLQFTAATEEQQLRDVFAAEGFQELVVQELTPLETNLLEGEQQDFPDHSRWSVRTEEASSEIITDMLKTLSDRIAPLDGEATTTAEVSGAVGGEVTRAAVLATVAATIIIMGFIWLAFRKVPHAFRYGACAIVAMFHDILMVLTIMSITGLLFDWQADSLFLTALLTVLGYSVQDTIVVFDRIRENLTKHHSETYEVVVNRSVLETIHRSLATQLNAVFVMIAIVLFGGETIRQFILIMLLGLTSGTYSSIFIAVPLLVSWEKGEIPFVNREAKQEQTITLGA